MPNENCLVGMSCPKCGQDAKFLIAARAWWEVTDDGTGEYEDVEWDDDTACICDGCHMNGTVKDFKPEVYEEAEC